MQSDELLTVLDELNGQESVIAVLGSELRKADKLREYADRGCCFLVVFAPEDNDTRRVIEIAKQHDYRFALKYGHVFIEHFEPE